MITASLASPILPPVENLGVRIGASRVAFVTSNTALACLAALSIRYGLDSESRAFCPPLWTDADTLPVSRLTELAGEFGFKARHVHRDWQWLQLAVISHPVLLLLQNTNVAIAIGSRGVSEEVIVLDPLHHDGEIYILPRSDLECAWNGDALIITPPTAETPLSAVALEDRDQRYRQLGATRCLLHPPSASTERPVVGRRLAVTVGVCLSLCLFGVSGTSLWSLTVPKEEETVSAKPGQATPKISKDTPGKHPDRAESPPNPGTDGIPAPRSSPTAAPPADPAIPPVAALTPSLAAASSAPSVAAEAPPPRGAVTPNPKANAIIPATLPAVTAPPPAEPVITSVATLTPGLAAASSPPSVAAETQPPRVAPISTPEANATISASLPSTTAPLPAEAAQMPRPAPASSPLVAAEAAELVERGDTLFAAGDVASARLFYERAADAGEAQAALRLGESFDPAFLEQARGRNGRGDLGMAKIWYRRARELGSAGAEILLKSLEGS